LNSSTLLSSARNILPSGPPSITVKWDYRCLFIILALIPFLLILWKFSYKESLALFSFSFFVILTVEAPKASLALSLAILSLDLNPSTCEYDPNSVFAFIVRANNLMPIHLFFEAGILTGWFIRRSLNSKTKYGASTLHWIIFAMLFWMALGQFAAVLNGLNPLNAIYGLRHILNYLMFYFIFDTLENEQDVKNIFYLVIAGTTITFFAGYFRVAAGQYIQWGPRRFYLWHEQVQTLHIMGLFALLAGMEKRIKFPFIAGLAVYLACLLQTFLSTSRAVLVGTFVTLLIILFLKIKNRIIFFASIGLFTVIAYLSINYLTEKMTGAVNEVAVQSMERLQSMNVQEADLSVLLRILTFQSALETAVKHPLFGIGFNRGFYLDLFGFKYYVRVLDNTYIKFALSAGFPLLILYLIFLFVIYRAGIRLLKHYPGGIIRAIILSCIGVVIMSNVVDLFQANFALLRIMYLIIFAISIIMKLDYLVKERNRSQGIILNENQSI